MPEGQKIDWHDLMEGYNHRYGTKHKTVRCFLRDAYNKIPHLIKCGDMLGVTNNTLSKEMDRQNLPRLPKGWRETPGLITLQALGDVSNMTSTEIAKEVGISEVYVCSLARQHNIKYIKRGDGRPCKK